MATQLVWFRNDLRITDNSALSAACRCADDKVIALFVATPEQWKNHNMAAIQAGFIRSNLLSLQHSLAALGIQLEFIQCDDFDASVVEIKRLCGRHGISDIYYNKQYQVNELRRDRQLEATLSPDIICHAFDDALLLPPNSVLTGNGDMYQIFTPFRNRFVSQIQQGIQPVRPVPKARGDKPELTAIPEFNYPILPHDDFPAGEQEAIQRLRTFCRERAADYLKHRDIPALDMTSRLSPYLAIGVLSVRQCYNRLLAEHPDFLSHSDSGAFTWFNELVWREFYHHLIVAYPQLCKHRPFIEWTQGVQWNPEEASFIAWCEGKTGYPIVDAAMRQLNQTGWMHNRLRMITASFLVKDLLIDWRRGERYFISRLIDGDLAANNGGWQWAASTGTDSAPYFRIFNPTTQGKRFDPQGHFIRQWVPELQEVAEKWIHTPHLWAEKQGIELDYPQPIVDHSQARINTLNAFEMARKGMVV